MIETPVMCGWHSRLGVLLLDESTTPREKAEAKHRRILAERLDNLHGQAMTLCGDREAERLAQTLWPAGQDVDDEWTAWDDYLLLLDRGWATVPKTLTAAVLLDLYRRLADPNRYEVLRVCDGCFLPCPFREHPERASFDSAGRWIGHTFTQWFRVCPHCDSEKWTMADDFEPDTWLVPMESKR